MPTKTSRQLLEAKTADRKAIQTRIADLEARIAVLSDELGDCREQLAADQAAELKLTAAARAGTAVQERLVGWDWDYEADQDSFDEHVRAAITGAIPANAMVLDAVHGRQQSLVRYILRGK